MLTAIPHHWFSWDFSLLDKGEPLAEIDMSSWREKGSLRVSDSSYLVYRERVLSGDFLLEANGTVIARAKKASAMTRRLLLTVADSQFELKPRSALTRKFDLLSNGVIVGTLAPHGFLNRRMSVDLPEDLPLPIRSFVVWLTLLMWKRESEAAA
jgi:hypothetical protein